MLNELDRYIEDGLIYALDVENPGFDIFDNRISELFNLRRENIRRIIKENIDLGSDISIHLPLYHPRWYDVSPISAFVFNKNEKYYELFKRLIKLNLFLTAKVKAKYLVIHMFCKEDDLDKKDYAKRLLDFSNFLSKYTAFYGVKAYVEYVGYLGHFYKPEDYVSFINDSENVGLCLDIGHAYMSSNLRGIDYYDLVDKFAPYVYPIHIWLAKNPELYSKYSHIPVHPDVLNEEGFLDLEKTLSILSRHRKDYMFINEVNINYKTLHNGAFFKEGHLWFQKRVKDIFS